MNPESERLIAAYFHISREQRRGSRRPDSAEKMLRALLQRARLEALERAAERDAWERAIDPR